MSFQYIFGPVASSRLGRSLGLDLLGSKICTFDCLYCEVGPTQQLTLQRKPYVPAQDILAELEAWQHANQDLALDHVTLGGSGEPTLNSELPAVIDGARRILPGVPVAVLTNSALMTDPAVRAELAEADTVLPSLDSLRCEPLAVLNRPNPRLLGGGTACQQAVDELAESLITFRKEFTGRLCLEIFLARGVNDSDEDLALFKIYVAHLRPDRVDVVTLSRPGAYAEAVPAASETLKRWRDALCPLCAVPDDAGARLGTAPPAGNAVIREADPLAVSEAVHASLARRPQTASQLASALDVSRATVVSALESLEKQGHITRRAEQDDEPFYGVRR